MFRSFSAPGWSTTLCGMPPEKTGVNENDWTPNWFGEGNVLTSVLGGKTRMPCVFQVKNNHTNSCSCRKSFRTQCLVNSLFITEFN